MQQNRPPVAQESGSVTAEDPNHRETTAPECYNKTTEMVFYLRTGAALPLRTGQFLSGAAAKPMWTRLRIEPLLPVQPIDFIWGDVDGRKPIAEWMEIVNQPTRSWLADLAVLPNDLLVATRRKVFGDNGEMVITADGRLAEAIGALGLMHGALWPSEHRKRMEFECKAAKNLALLMS